jgi:hypothetical protein
LLPKLIFSTVKADPSLADNQQSVNNLHFNYIPDSSISPSRNLYAALVNVESLNELSTEIVGVALRLDRSRRMLYFYGSFIIAATVDRARCIESLVQVGITAHSAMFSSYILPESMTQNLKSPAENKLLENRMAFVVGVKMASLADLW